MMLEYFMTKSKVTSKISATKLQGNYTGNMKMSNVSQFK